MKMPPVGWPRLSSAVYCVDPAAEIDWLCRAFGFEVRIKVEGPERSIEHSELTFGEAVVMVAGEGVGADRPGAGQHRSPRSIGGVTTQGLMLYVDDADAHCAQARSAGAAITIEPKTTDYGPGYWVDRSYQVQDPEGHRWWFAQRVRENPK